jgi:RNA polymerase sigma-70 factor, ECF subfamily
MTLPVQPPLEALAAGQPAAFAALYDRMATRLLRVACAMLGSADEAEDALHDLFVNLVRARERFRLVEDLDAYVFACLRHAAAGRLERRQTQQRNLHDMAWARGMDSQAPPEVHDDVHAAMDSLPPEQREVVAMKIDGGLTFAQIGAVLGVSLNTAASRYRYALDKLRHVLDPEKD